MCATQRERSKFYFRLIINLHKLFLSKFVTAGADGDIRIWPTNDKEDVQHTCVGEWVLCVRNKGENFYVSTNNNDVQILSLPNGERMGILDRFVAPINHIAFAKNANVFQSNDIKYQPSNIANF